MRHLLVYSSLTGNTKKVALAVHSVLPPETPIFDIKNVPAPDEYDCLSLGFWVHQAKPDPRMWKYMEKIADKKVAFFGTMAAYPDSDHAEKVVRNVYERLSSNTILGHFLCQGKLAAKRFDEYMSGRQTRPNHPLTPERRARLIEANRHPNEDDCRDAAMTFRTLFSRTLD